MDFASIVMKQILIAIILFAFMGCNQFKKGEGDLLYRIHTNVDGPTIQVGDLVELTAIEKTEAGKVLWRSCDEDRTALVTRAPSLFAGDLFTALGKLSEGDSATVKIKMDSMKAVRFSGKYLVYELRIHHVLPARAADSFMHARMKQLKVQEPVKLAAFTKHLTLTAQPSGLQYLITTRGTGKPANTGDTVYLKYTAKLMSGRIIDTALHTPRVYITGFNSTIAGLEEAMQLFPEQTKATVILPSSLAFGETGYEGIQPYTPLVYDLEVVRIARATGKRPTEPGAPLPDFHFTNIANNVLVQKEDVAKGPCLFVLFSTDCEHCRQLIADLEKRDHPQIYLVSPDSREAILLATARLSKKPNVTILHDDQKIGMGRFQATGFPSVYEYDRHHRLVKYLK
jgi:FKBP-type peptidyl-prolyl cis-trans isomerase